MSTLIRQAFERGRSLRRNGKRVDEGLLHGRSPEVVRANDEMRRGWQSQDEEIKRKRDAKGFGR